MNRLVVKQNTFWHSRHGMALGALLVLLLVWGIYEFGRYRGGHDAIAAAEEVERLEQKIAEQQQQQTQMREQYTILERSGQIEKQAYKQLEGAVAGLQDELQELKGELAFYRGIVSPKDAAKGLRIQSFELSAGEQPRHYRYKIVLTQVLNNGTVARGDVQFELEGVHQGERKSYTLDQLSDSSAKGPAFKFKYFQILEGDLTVPEEFEPMKVSLTVRPKGKKLKKLTQAFDWVVEEKS